MLPGQLCWGVVDTEQQEKKAGSCPGTYKVGILLESKGGKLILTDGGREDLALNPGVTQSREYAGGATFRDTDCRPETYPRDPLAGGD